MKRLSTSATILVSALLINTPAFAADKKTTSNVVTKSEDNAAVTVVGEALGAENEETAAPESNESIEKASKSVSNSDKNNALNQNTDTNNAITPESGLESELKLNADSAASETSDISNELDEEVVENASDTAEVKNPKKQEPKEDNPWAEKVSGKQLNTLKSKLDSLQELYDINWRSYCIAEAINHVERADSPQKRNASLLGDLTRQQLFTAYAVTYVFPELLEIHLQNVSEHLKKKAASLVDEIAETEEETKEIINSFVDDVNHYRTINGAYIALVDKVQTILDSIVKTNTNTANLTGFGYYLKNTNDELLKLVSSQLDALREVTEQSSFTVDYCRQQAEFVAASKESISIKSKYFAEIRSSFKDLEIYLEKYKNQQEFNFHQLNRAINDRYNELIEKVGKDEIRVARIRKLVKETSFKPVNKSIQILSTQSDLEDIFEKFGFKEVDTKLFETLLAYVGEENWHCRYKEPVSDEEKEKKKETGKDNSGEKPKLIDLEDEPEAVSDVEAESGTEPDSEIEIDNATGNATATIESGTEASLADSPGQITEQKQEEGNSRVEADSSGISSDTEKINQDHIE